MTLTQDELTALPVGSIIRPTGHCEFMQLALKTGPNHWEITGWNKYVLSEDLVKFSDSKWERWKAEPYDR